MYSFFAARQMTGAAEHDAVDEEDASNSAGRRPMSDQRSARRRCMDKKHTSQGTI